MRRIAIWIFLCLAMNSYSQVLMKTYYYGGYGKIAEIYYVNSKGEKNGSYKSYAESGVIQEEATYKNGLLNGVHKKYDVSSGRQILLLKETYLEDVLNGEFSEYEPNGKYTYRHGNYLNGERDGTWTFLLDSYNPIYFGIHDKPPAGYELLKTVANYKNDVQVGIAISYYYPICVKVPGKIYSKCPPNHNDCEFWTPDGKPYLN